MNGRALRQIMGSMGGVANGFHVTTVLTLP